MTSYSSAAPLTQAHVESEIVRISAEMESSLNELARYTESSAHAEAEHKVGYAKALLKAANQPGSGRNGKLTEGDKEATATVECEFLLRARLIAEAHRDVAQEKMRMMRSQLDSLRTVSANIRAQT